MDDAHRLMMATTELPEKHEKWGSKRHWKEGKVLGWVGLGVELGSEEMLQLTLKLAARPNSYALPTAWMHTSPPPSRNRLSLLFLVC